MVHAARYRRPGASLGAIIEVRGIHGDFDNVLAGTHKHFVDLGWADGPHMIQRTGFVRSIEELWSAVSIPVERLILQIVVVCGVETQALFVREVYVHTHRVFPLVERVPLGAKPVTVPSNERVRDGPHIKNPDSVGA